MSSNRLNDHMHSQANDQACDKMDRNSQTSLFSKARLMSWMTGEHWMLAGWPPLASHLAFLLLGAACANLFLPTMVTSPKISRQKIIVSFAPDERLLTQPTSPGARLWAVKSEKDQADCRLQHSPLTVISVDRGFAVSFDLRESDTLPAVLKAEKNKKLRLLDEAAVASMSICKPQRMVRYGSGT